MSKIKTRIDARIMGKLFLVLFLGFSLLSPGVFALADDHGQMGRSDDQQHRRHSDHYYRNGHWYRHGWFGFEVSAPVLSTGVYVNTLPPTYTPVVIRGTTYYYGDNTYFVASPDGGYTVVSTPVNQ
jgi:hypothetical protein